MDNLKGASRISVITPCLNGERYMQAAIESVMNQRYPAVEHIVVDGGSSDGSLELLKAYPHLKVLNGPDGGVYDALNKALAVAQGDIVGILNSDDLYADDFFSYINESFFDPAVMAVAGDAISFRGATEDDQSVVDTYTAMADDLLLRSTLGNPSMNSWFFRAAVFERIGRFDSSYRVAGDREFMLRLACSGLRYERIPRLVYRYRIHPGSLTFGGGPQIWKTIAHEHGKLADDYLRKQDLPAEARKLIRQSRTRDTLRMAIRASRQLELGDFMAHAWAGTRHDPWWPLRFAKQALSSLAARIT
jgi:glycosyltransferase involved in cell wall biosynthesis